MSTTPRPLGRYEILDCFERAGVRVGTDTDYATRLANAAHLAIAATHAIPPASMAEAITSVVESYLTHGVLADQPNHREKLMRLAREVTGMARAVPDPVTGETDLQTALRFKREADALWKRLNPAEINAARYAVWRDHMLTADEAFMRRMQEALPADVGLSRSPTAAEWDAAIDKASGKPHAAPASDALTVADYEEVLASHRALVRKLDVLLNGEAGAAKQASLADIVAQMERTDVSQQARLYRDFTTMAQELRFDSVPDALDELRSRLGGAV